MSVFFDQAYFGNIYDVKIVTEKTKQKNAPVYHVMTSFVFFDVLSTNYDYLIHRIASDKIVSSKRDGNIITIVAKTDSGGNAQLSLEALSKADELLAAAKVIPREEVKAMSTTDKLIPFLKWTDDLSKTQEIVNERCTKILLTFGTGLVSFTGIVDIVLCILKLKFTEYEDLTQVLDIVERDLKLYFVDVWIHALQTAVQHENNSHEYIVRLVANLTNTIGMLCDILEINTDKLCAATALFCDEKNPVGVIHESKILEATINGLLADRKQDAILDRFYKIAVVAFSSRIVNGGMGDVNSLRNECVNYAVEPENEALNKIVDMKLKLVIGDMLRMSNEIRYTPVFQYVFAVWPFRNNSLEKEDEDEIMNYSDDFE